MARPNLRLPTTALQAIRSRYPHSTRSAHTGDNMQWVHNHQWWNIGGHKTTHQMHQTKVAALITCYSLNGQTSYWSYTMAAHPPHNSPLKATMGLRLTRSLPHEASHDYARFSRLTDPTSSSIKQSHLKQYVGKMVFMYKWKK